MYSALTLQLLARATPPPTVAVVMVSRFIRQQGMSMNGTQHREIACAIMIDTCGRFLLQQRDDVPGIVCPGMVGLFGGHREGTETFLQCVVREVHEETTYFVAPQRFAPLTSYKGPDPDVGYGSLHCEFFGWRSGSGWNLVGVVSVFNLESSDVGAPERRPRHDKRYHEV